MIVDEKEFVDRVFFVVYKFYKKIVMGIYLVLFLYIVFIVDNVKEDLIRYVVLLLLIVINLFNF